MTRVEWRTVPGYEGLYEVSSGGEVRRMTAAGAPGRLLKVHASQHTVGLTKSGRTTTYRISRLVAVAFLGFVEGRVYHANGDHSDNRPENLLIVRPGVCKRCGEPRTETCAEALCRACLNATKLRLRRIRHGQDPDAPVRRGRTDKCLVCGAPRANLGKHARCRACYNAEQRMYAERRRAQGAQAS